MQPDVACDIRSLPYRDGEVDEVMAIHVFEHFYLKEVDDVLAEWRRVLKKGGLLVLEMPCLDKVLQWFRQPNPDIRMTMFPLFGDPSTHASEHDLHKWCWSQDMIKQVLEKNGFTNVLQEKPHYHVPNRDMRVVAVKE